MCNFLTRQNIHRNEWIQKETCVQCTITVGRILINGQWPLCVFNNFSINTLNQRCKAFSFQYAYHNFDVPILLSSGVYTRPLSRVFATVVVTYWSSVPTTAILYLSRSRASFHGAVCADIFPFIPQFVFRISRVSSRRERTNDVSSYE